MNFLVLEAATLTRIKKRSKYKMGTKKPLENISSGFF
jgi:hypothetical protein